MGKKNKERPVKPYTESERRRKINAIILEMSAKKCDELLQITNFIPLTKDFIEKGTALEKDIPLIALNRIMQIRLYNDKRRPPMVKLTAIDLDNETLDAEKEEKEQEEKEKKEQEKKTGTTLPQTVPVQTVPVQTVPVQTVPVQTVPVQTVPVQTNNTLDTSKPAMPVEKNEPIVSKVV